MSLTEFSVGLKKRLAQMESDIFQHPPKAWEDFQKRLGAYQELSLSVVDINTLIRGEEEDLS